MSACRLMVATSLWLLSMAVSAQTLTKPKEFYFDEDKAAAPISVASGEGEVLAANLLKMSQRGDRRASEAVAQLGHLAFNDSRIELGESLYKEARGSGRPDAGAGRSVTWNYAWDLYHAGQPEKALQQWSLIANSALGGPSWMPPTLAMVLWRLDRKEEAVTWYAAAVRTEPDQWSDASRLEALLPGWRAEDRATLAEVLAAWQKAPPSWP